MQLTNFSYTDKPHPMVEGTVPGLSQEAFDREWNPRVTSIMCVDSFTRRCAVFTHLPTENSPTDGKHSTAAKAHNSSTDDYNCKRNPGDTECSGNETNEISSSTSVTLGYTEMANKMDSERVFLNWSRLAKDCMVFGASCEFTMTPALYDPDVPKWPLDFRFSLGSVGACSLTVTTAFYAHGENGRKILLWSNVYQLVMIDKTTRQPIKTPSWFLEKYKDRGVLKESLVIRPFKKPDVTFRHPILVQWSDTDEFGHASWSSYIRWATDALQAALLAGCSKSQKATSTATRQGVVQALCGISKEMVARGLSKFQVSFYRECLEGEQVEVHVWQDKSAADPGLVWCSLVKQWEEVCQIKLWYFTDTKI